MQNIINNLAKINFEFVECFEGNFKELPEFEVNDDCCIFSVEKRLKISYNTFPYIIFDLKNYKDEYIFKCLDLLDEFYKNRDTENSHRLKFENIFDSHNMTTKIMLKPILGECLTMNDEKTLKIFQNEFRDLGLFLNSKNFK